VKSKSHTLLGHIENLHEIRIARGFGIYNFGWWIASQHDHLTTHCMAGVASRVDVLKCMRYLHPPNNSRLVRASFSRLKKVKVLYMKAGIVSTQISFGVFVISSTPWPPYSQRSQVCVPSSLTRTEQNLVRATGLSPLMKSACCVYHSLVSRL